MKKYGFLAALVLIFSVQSVQAGPIIEWIRSRRQGCSSCSAAAAPVQTCSGTVSAPIQTVTYAQTQPVPVQQASYVQTAPIPVTGFSFLPVADCVNGNCPAAVPAPVRRSR